MKRYRNNIFAILTILTLSSCVTANSKAREESLLFYEKEMTATSNVFCWKNEKGDYRCGVLSPHYGINPSKRLLSFMRDELPCSLNDMKALIDRHYRMFGTYVSPNRQNKIFEVSKTLVEDGTYEWKISESKDRDLYASLGLKDALQNGFSGISPNAPDFTKIKDKDEYAKTVTNDSLIFCWKTIEGEWLCGSPCISKYVSRVDFDAIRWMQEKMPLKLEEMASFLKDFSSFPSGYKTFKYLNNAVVEIPAGITEEQWSGLQFNPHDEKFLAKNRNLYVSLGLEDVYLGIIEAVEFGPVGNERFPSLIIDREELEAFYKKSFSRCDQVYYWRKNGSYFALPHSGSTSIHGLTEFVAFAQEELPCPLEYVKEFLPAEREGISVYEIEYPFLFDSKVSPCTDENVLRAIER
ncbi:MAG: hypothetical protein K6B51_06310 [Bacilli bacterium]|nr:hypothetical protein [Bacilli bacterium]